MKHDTLPPTPPTPQSHSVTPISSSNLAAVPMATTQAIVKNDVDDDDDDGDNGSCDRFDINRALVLVEKDTAGNLQPSSRTNALETSDVIKTSFIAERHR